MKKITKLSFCVEYRTKWGESLYVSLHIYNKVKKEIETMVALSTSDGIVWQGTYDFNAADESKIEYKYVVVENGVSKTAEAECERRHVSVASCEEYSFIDIWRRESDFINVFDSSALKDSLFGHQEQPMLKYDDSQQAYIIKVHNYALPVGKSLAVCGNRADFGAWNPDGARRMHQLGAYDFYLQIPNSALPLDFKFILLDGEKPIWEEGNNRFADFSACHTQQEFKPRFGNSMPRISGLVVPLFSIRCDNGYGIGDFSCLKKMVDWCALSGMNLIQLLPINDTTTTETWRDSYPYNCLSVFALHPIYLDISKMIDALPKVKADACKRDFKSLNEMPSLDYERVYKHKMLVTQNYFSQNKRDIITSKSFIEFCSVNASWLKPYAAFRLLQKKNNTANFRTWKQHAVYSQEAIEKMFRDKDADELYFFCFLQFELHKQMKQAHDYARSKHIILKGDIPIGVSRDSVPVWVEPQCFNVDTGAGAPPDDFAVNGQNWGFPTYNWKEMAKDGYKWWKSRLTKMAESFDAFRIDHVLGFFRIWEIPYDSIYGIMGHFNPAMPLTRMEIEQAGLIFREQRFTEASFSESEVSEIFERYSDEAYAMLLEKNDEDGRWRIKKDFDTQRKAFEKLGDTPVLRDMLCKALSQVLFVRDGKENNKFHPRITAQHTQVYNSLLPSEKDAFNEIYDNFYYHRHNHFWQDEAMEKLPPLIKATKMLPCAEDLGMVPDCVKDVLSELNILTLEIQRMPKEYGLRFGRTEHNPYLSVATIATHDMSTLRAWWSENAEQTSAFCHEVLGREYDASETDPNPQTCESVVVKHLDSPSMICALSLQDWLSISSNLRRTNPLEERINDPSNPNQNWNWRMHISIDKLMMQTDFNDKLRDLIRRSGR